METGGPTTTRESPLQRGVVRRPPGTSPRPAERIATRRASCSALQRARSEQLLVVAAKRGGMRERERMIEAFRPAIAHIARRYRRQAAVSWMELMQEGVVGLLRALERYDPQRGSRFWAYASWWVRQAMQQVVSELSGPVGLSDRAPRQPARSK